MTLYKRGDTWWVKIKFKGEEIRKSARTKVRAEAAEFERSLRAECARLYRGGKPRYSYRETFARFNDEYLPDLKPKTRKRYLSSVKMMDTDFGHLFLDEITKDKITDYQVKRKRDGSSNATINRDIAMLSSMLTCAVDWGYLDMNPVKMMGRRNLKEANARRRYLSEKEYKRLLDSCKLPRLKSLIVVAVETGMRRQELLNLEWKQINWQRNEITLTKTKTDSPRIIPISKEAGVQIRAQPRHLKCPYVFTADGLGPYVGIQTAFNTLCTAAKLKDICWHDLRRTCGTWMLQRGVDLKTVSVFLGHKTVAVTERTYAFLNTKNLHEAVTRGTKRGTDAAVYKSVKESKNATSR